MTRQKDYLDLGDELSDPFRRFDAAHIPYPEGRCPIESDQVGGPPLFEWLPMRWMRYLKCARPTVL